MKSFGSFWILFGLVVFVHEGQTTKYQSKSIRLKVSAAETDQKLLAAMINVLRQITKANTVLKNCAELYEAGYKQSSVYTIDPDGKGEFEVYCDQKSSPGGWTVFQKRQDGSENFYRGWNDYKNGFGDLKGEFWLGLDKINRLTNQAKNRLRVDLNGGNLYAEYNYFAVTSEQYKYKLNLGNYSGNAGDSLTNHSGMAFSTKDSDNDLNNGNCAVDYKGAWWYNTCYTSHLNGLYSVDESMMEDGVDADDQTIGWRSSIPEVTYFLTKTEMKIRPQ